MGTGVSGAEPAAERVAVGTPPLAEVALFALRTLVDDDVGRQRDGRSRWHRPTPPEGGLPAGARAVGLPGAERAGLTGRAASFRLARTGRGVTRAVTEGTRAHRASRRGPVRGRGVAGADSSATSSTGAGSASGRDPSRSRSGRNCGR